ncbi:MAG: nucleotidyltransferase domain-containing protein [Verrucomicrobia bacterium]|nr:nucleotidyltransferase domain-containing protein [Verrucomicrobiota bacterium]
MFCAVSLAGLPIQIDREKIAEFCRSRGIRKLSLFGSVLRDDFDPALSDVDVLAEFEPDALKGVGFRYFGCEILVQSSFLFAGVAGNAPLTCPPNLGPPVSAR